MDHKSSVKAQTQAEIVARQSARDPEIICETAYYQSGNVWLSIDVYRPNAEKYPGVRPGILFFFGGGFRVGTPLAFREQALICAKQWRNSKMNRNYRSYCRRMGEAMSLRSVFPRSVLDNDELIRIYQTAQTTDLNILRQTAAELFPERFQEGLTPEEQALSVEQDETHKTCIGMVQSY